MIPLRAEGRSLRVAHRGAAALAPENTLTGLRAAVELGVDYIEFDVLEHEGELVLSHSPIELPQERTTLDDALGYLADAGVGAHVDLKARGLEARIVDAVRRHDLVERSLVSSLDHGALRELRAHEPALRVGLSYPEDRYGVSRYRAAGPAIALGLSGLKRVLPRMLGRWLRRGGASAAVLHHALVTPAIVDRCHALDAALWAWTVNDIEIARRLERWGTDAIISDDPRIFL